VPQLTAQRLSREGLAPELIDRRGDSRAIRFGQALDVLLGISR